VVTVQEKMADYTSAGPSGAAPNGQNLNGTGDSAFQAATMSTTSNEAAKTLW
jgi:hypothetical protein